MATKEELLQKLQDAVKAAVELRIVTYVGNVELGGTLANGLTVTFGSPNQVILTSINLAQGDILNVVPPNFDTEFDKSVLAFHQAQVKEGREIVTRNLEIIGRVGRQLINLVVQSPQAQPLQAPPQESANPSNG